MPECPACRRPVAMVRATCVYCGAALPAAAVEEAAKGAEAVAATPPAGALPAPRFVLIIDLDSGTEDEVAAALGISRFEAGQRQRRGGLQLFRIGEEREALETAGTLRE